MPRLAIDPGNPTDGTQPVAAGYEIDLKPNLTDENGQRAAYGEEPTPVCELGHPHPRTLSRPKESIDTVRVEHSLGSPATLVAMSDLLTRF